RPAARLAELQQRRNFKTLEFISHAPCLAKLLRVADPALRGGAPGAAATAEPQGASNYLARALPGEAAAGRRPALRSAALRAAATPELQRRFNLFRTRSAWR